MDSREIEASSSALTQPQFLVCVIFVKPDRQTRPEGVSCLSLIKGKALTQNSRAAYRTQFVDFRSFWVCETGWYPEKVEKVAMIALITCPPTTPPPSPPS